MKGYNLGYDPSSKKLIVREFEVGSGPNYNWTNVKASNLKDAQNGFNFDKSVVLQDISTLNDAISKGDMLVRRCKDCGEYFFINLDEQIFFEERHLSLPKRCESCRLKRKKSV